MKFEDCITLAFDQMMPDYRNIILDMIYSNPEDKKKKMEAHFGAEQSDFPKVLDFCIHRVDGHGIFILLRQHVCLRLRGGICS
eukprot:UN06627